MKTIEANAYVELDLDLKLADGEVLQEAEPIAYVHGYGLLVPGLEARLSGLAVGDERAFEIPPDEGFGDYDEEMVMVVDKSELPKDVKVDDEFEAEAADGEEALFRVVNIDDEGVWIDANHPLAGEALHFGAKVKSIRQATESEIAEAARMFEETRESMDPDPLPAQIFTSESMKKKLN
jgi:FKBP-type peptidyl-prolyl cis-trans isomerase SlyD